MPARFFLEGMHAVDDVVALDAADARKIVTVLRMRDGDEIEAIDSGSTRFRAIVEIGGAEVRARLIESLRARPASGLRVVVAQGIPKGQKMDFVVEKLTELGAAEIVPLRSARAVADASPAKLERWRRLARTAAMQCGRAEVPPVSDPVDIDGLAERCRSFDLVLVPWESADPVAMRDVLPGLLAGARSVLIAIGPEGGFAQDEVARLESAGARAISLGSRILRTETAGLAMLAMLDYATG
ncbi:MAG: RsmE family RNA methyltransferase [Candidatus Eremiobacterales bacterium]